MSSGDRLLMILHIGFAIFALGPITAATMASPRYIRQGNASVVRYLNRATRIYGLLTLGIFLFGALLVHGKFDRAWLSASMTLFIVAFALLIIIERDQRKALHKIEVAAAEHRAVEVEAAPTTTTAPAESTTPPTTVPTDKPVAGGEPPAEQAPEPRPRPAPVAEREPARVETGRIATISGVVALIWIVILVLMVWNA
jgi:cell division septation protein DedD